MFMTGTGKQLAPPQFQRIWRTYVKQGAYVPEVSVFFGEECPEPDFERARNQKLAMPWRGWRMRTLATVGGGMLLLPVMGAQGRRSARC